MRSLNNMDVPIDLCFDTGDSADVDICHIQKADICSLDLDSRSPEDPYSSRKARPLSDTLADLRNSSTAMQSYRLSAQLLVDAGLGLQEDFFQSWLDYSDEAPQEGSSTNAKTNVSSNDTKGNTPPNPLLFALSKPKKDLKLTSDQTGAGSLSSSDETEAGMASSSLHGESPRKDAFRLREKDQAWTSNPFDDELNMIETMIAEDRISKLPPSAATAGWTQGIEKRESAHYAKIQVPHRVSKAPKLPLKNFHSEEELDLSLGDFDYSQFHQPPNRPSVVPLKESSTPKMESYSGPIVIKTSRQIFDPKAQVETFAATSRLKTTTEKVQRAPIKPLISFNEPSATAMVSSNGGKVVGKLSNEKYLPAHPLAKVSEETTAEPVVAKKIEADIPSKSLPKLPTLLSSSTKMPGSWSLSETSTSPTLSENDETESRSFGFNRLKDVFFPSSVSASYTKKPSLEKEKSLGNLFAAAGKHGLRKEKDFFRPKPKVKRESIIMPSISLQEHFKGRNAPVIVMKRRPAQVRAAPMQVPGHSMTLREHFTSRNTPVTVMDTSSNSTLPISSPRIAATYPRKVNRKPSQRQ